MHAASTIGPFLPGLLGRYDERTRHTNADYPKRMSEDELKQSAIVMATFAWQAAMADEKVPRMNR